MRTVVRAINKAPGYGVAALAAGGGIQGSLGCVQCGGTVSGCRDQLRLLTINLTHFIAEGAVLAVQLIGVGLLFLLGIRLLAHFVQAVGVRVILKEFLDL